MKKKVKILAASIMAAITVMSTMAAPCFAAGNGRIGVKYYWFNYWTKKIYVGDCNGDGQISIADLWILRYVGDYGSVVWKADNIYDCNGDGKINSADADALQAYILSHGKM